MGNRAVSTASSLTRRDVIKGAASAVLLVSATQLPTAAIAAPLNVTSLERNFDMGLRRYMAAAAALGDGRILITGGFDQPSVANRPLFALASAVIFDPLRRTLTNVSPMLLPRARHASATLIDGRVVVIGGISAQPTATVEIYDPSTDTWSPSRPLTNARYDHVATSDGSGVFVIGGTSQSIVSAIETIYPASETTYSPSQK